MISLLFGKNMSRGRKERYHETMADSRGSYCGHGCRLSLRNNRWCSHKSWRSFDRSDYRYPGDLMSSHLPSLAECLVTSRHECDALRCSSVRYRQMENREQASQFKVAHYSISCFSVSSVPPW